MSEQRSEGLPARPLAVFDLDGVLADVRHRLHHLEHHPKNWRGFFRAAPRDPLHPEGAALAHEAAIDCEIVYLTGRPEVCRPDTVAWLAAQGLPQGQLVMRSDRDHRAARQAKPELLRQVAEGREVAIVVDDDLEVCDAYEQAGFRVLRAIWAPRSDTLVQAQEDAGRT
jgi:phosphoglycolate phosphatase-like HAD superfamily hydrolase